MAAEGLIERPLSNGKWKLSEKGAANFAEIVATPPSETFQPTGRVIVEEDVTAQPEAQAAATLAKPADNSATGEHSDIDRTIEDIQKAEKALDNKLYHGDGHFREVGRLLEEMGSGSTDDVEEALRGQFGKNHNTAETLESMQKHGLIEKVDQRWQYTEKAQELRREIVEAEELEHAETLKKSAVTQTIEAAKPDTVKPAEADSTVLAAHESESHAKHAEEPVSEVPSTVVASESEPAVVAPVEPARIVEEPKVVAPPQEEAKTAVEPAVVASDVSPIQAAPAPAPTEAITAALEPADLTPEPRILETGIDAAADASNTDAAKPAVSDEDYGPQTTDEWIKYLGDAITDAHTAALALEPEAEHQQTPAQPKVAPSVEKQLLKKLDDNDMTILKSIRQMRVFPEDQLRTLLTNFFKSDEVADQKLQGLKDKGLIETYGSRILVSDLARRVINLKEAPAQSQAKSPYPINKEAQKVLSNIKDLDQWYALTQIQPEEPLTKEELAGKLTALSAVEVTPDAALTALRALQEQGLVKAQGGEWYLTRRNPNVEPKPGEVTGQDVQETMRMQALRDRERLRAERAAAEEFNQAAGQH